MKTYDEKLKARILEYIKKYHSQKGHTPSFRVIMRGLNISSVPKVQRYIKKLTEEGSIERNHLGGVEIADLKFKGGFVNASVIGNVACGDPKLAFEDKRAVVSLPTEIFGGGNTYILTADGDSMIDEGIDSGDLLVVKNDSDYESGDLVIALVGDSATAKRIYMEGGKIILHPANKKMKDIIVEDMSELRIQGRVVNVIKNIHRYKERIS